MTDQPDFSAMSRAELRAYVLQHRNDDEALYAFADKIYASPGIKIQSMEHLAQLIEERRKANQENPEE
jgi:hypothetical protein